MALTSIPVPPDPARDERAGKLVDSVGAWPRVTLNKPWGSFEAGTTFRRAYGSDGARYLVNSVACTCPDHAEAGFVCKHVRAHVIWEQRQAEDAAVDLAFAAAATRLRGPQAALRYVK